MNHRETSFTGNIAFEDRIIAANFNKIGKDIFIANFKLQEEFKFQEKLTFKNKSKELTVLLPSISKYNKRKLLKLSKFFETPEEKETGAETGKNKDKYELIIAFASVEKFLKIDELLDFFSLNREDVLEFLVQKEIEQQIKIIDFYHLCIISNENLESYLEELNQIFTECFTNRVKNIKLLEIETRTKLPQSSIFFKYLLHRLTKNFSYRIVKDEIIFQKLALSETEKNSLDAIENIVKKNKLSVFTIENIIDNSDMLYKEVNDSLWVLVENGKIVQLTESFFILKEELHKIINRLKKFKRNEGEIISIQALREMTYFPRKYLIILFEYFDSQRITQRVDNNRKILLSV